MGFFSGVKSFFKDNKEAVAGGLAAGSFGLQIVDSLLNQKQLERQNKQVDEQNALARESFDYNKYLNENRYQISAMDAQKAGINPIAMTGANLTSSSVSPAVSPSRNSTGFGSEGLAMLSSILLEQEKLKTEKDKIDSEKDIANNNNETAIEIAKIQAGQSDFNSQRSFDSSIAKIQSDSENLRQQREQILLLDKMNKEFSSWQSENAYRQAKADFEAQQDKFENDYNVTRSQLTMALEDFWRSKYGSGKYDRSYESTIGKLLGDIFKFSKETAYTFGSALNEMKKLWNKPDEMTDFIKSLIPEYKRSKYYDYVKYEDYKK